MRLRTLWARVSMVTVLVGFLLPAVPGAASDAAGKARPRPASSLQQARRLVAELRQELAPVEDEIRNHPFLDELERGEVPLETLQGFAVEEYRIIQSDLRSQALLVSRFGITPSGDFFKGLADGERIAFDLICRFGDSTGLDAEALARSEPRAGAQAFPNAVVAMAAFGTEADAAAAFLVNFGVFGENTARMATALQDVYGFTAEEVEFFSFFGEPIPGFEEAAIRVIAAGLDKGARPAAIRRAARLLQEYELEFWNTVALAP